KGLGFPRQHLRPDVVVDEGVQLLLRRRTFPGPGEARLQVRDVRRGHHDRPRLAGRESPGAVGREDGEAQQQEGEQRLASPGHEAGEPTARQRKTRPATATATPAARRAARPAGQRWESPMRMPSPWRHPVATTKPRLKRRALVPGGSSAPWAYPWKTAKTATRPMAAGTGGRASAATTAPRASADSAIPASTNGTGRPTSPRNPPTAIIIGNVTGSSHTAGGPSCAPQSPTATMARTWSHPESGCPKPDVK